MNNKLILMLVMILFSMSFVVGQDCFYGTREQNSCIDIIQTCSSCTYNNISSILYPNGTEAPFSPEIEMTNSGIRYSFNTCNLTSNLGTYLVNGHGDLKGTDQIWKCRYEVTPSGQEVTEGKTLGGLAVLFGVFAVAFTFLFIGNKLSANDRTLPIGFFFFVMAFFLVIYSLHLGWIFSVNILQDEILSQGMSQIFVIVIWSCSGIAIISTALMFFAFVKELGKMNKQKKFGEDFNPITDTY